jgi:hypothetical protein
VRPAAAAAIAAVFDLELVEQEQLVA